MSTTTVHPPARPAQTRPRARLGVLAGFALAGFAASLVVHVRTWRGAGLAGPPRSCSWSTRS